MASRDVASIICLALADGPLDQLEAHPLAAGVFAALEHISRGGVVDVEPLNVTTPTPRLVTLIASLVVDSSVAALSRFLVIKAVLRSHRQAVDAAAAAAAAAAADAGGNASAGEAATLATLPAEAAAASIGATPSFAGDPVLAGDSTEHATAAEPEPRSLLEAHARMLLPALLRGLLDVSTGEGCKVGWCKLKPVLKAHGFSACNETMINRCLVLLSISTCARTSGCCTRHCAKRRWRR